MANKKKVKSSSDGKYHFVNFLKNWLHQAITYMDTGERNVRLAMESVEIVIVWLLLENIPAFTTLNIYLLLLVAALLTHTLNWIFNGNFWALYLFAVPAARNRGESETVDYLNDMAKRLDRYKSVSGLAIFGSVTRGKWHECSDIDIRIVRKPGLSNLVAAALISIKERFIAFLQKQPLDLFLADDINFLRKMRDDERPIFLLKKDIRLENAYPDNASTTLTHLK